MAKRTTAYIGLGMIAVTVLGAGSYIYYQKVKRDTLLKALDDAYNKGKDLRDDLVKGSKNITLSEVGARDLARKIAEELNSTFNVDEDMILDLLESELKSQEDYTLLSKQFKLVAKKSLPTELKGQLNPTEKQRLQTIMEKLK